MVFKELELDNSSALFFFKVIFLRLDLYQLCVSRFNVAGGSGTNWNNYYRAAGENICMRNLSKSGNNALQKNKKGKLDFFKNPIGLNSTFSAVHLDYKSIIYIH